MCRFDVSGHRVAVLVELRFTTHVPFLSASIFQVGPYYNSVINTTNSDVLIKLIVYKGIYFMAEEETN